MIGPEIGDLTHQLVKIVGLQLDVLVLEQTCDRCLVEVNSGHHYILQALEQVVNDLSLGLLNNILQSLGISSNWKSVWILANGVNLSRHILTDTSLVVVDRGDYAFQIITVCGPGGWLVLAHRPEITRVAGASGNLSNLVGLGDSLGVAIHSRSVFNRVSIKIGWNCSRRRSVRRNWDNYLLHVPCNCIQRVVLLIRVSVFVGKLERQDEISWLRNGWKIYESIRLLIVYFQSESAHHIVICIVQNHPCLEVVEVLQVDWPRVCVDAQLFCVTIRFSGRYKNAILRNSKQSQG